MPGCGVWTAPALNADAVAPSPKDVPLSGAFVRAETGVISRPMPLAR